MLELGGVNLEHTNTQYEDGRWEKSGSGDETMELLRKGTGTFPVRFQVVKTMISSYSHWLGTIQRI